MVSGVRILAAICWLTVAAAVCAQAPGRVPRVGVLHAGTAKEPASNQREPFERGLRELGWKPGTDIIIDYRFAEGDVSKLGALAQELVRSRVDVIVARAAPSIRAARAATGSIPIVMATANTDPVAEGWAKSLSRPGGNVTGMASFVYALDGKRLEVLKEAFPAVNRVAVLANPNVDAGRYEERIGALERQAHSLKVQLEVFLVKRRADLATTLDALVRSKPDAVLVRADPEVIEANPSQITSAIGAHRLPAVYPWRHYVLAGGLMSYGESVPGFHHRSATYVHRILKGTPATDLPIEQPSKHDLAINIGAAKAQGLEISKVVLFRANDLVH